MTQEDIGKLAQAMANILEPRVRRLEDLDKDKHNRLTALEEIDRRAAIGCPLYPGKGGEERLNKVEQAILEGKWLLRCLAIAGFITWGKDWWPVISKALGGP